MPAEDDRPAHLRTGDVAASPRRIPSQKVPDNLGEHRRDFERAMAESSARVARDNRTLSKKKLAAKYPVLSKLSSAQ